MFELQPHIRVRHRAMGTTWDLRVATGPERRIFTPQYNMDQNAEAATGFFTGHRSSRLICCGQIRASPPSGSAGGLWREPPPGICSACFLGVCVWKRRVYNGYIACWCIFNSEHKDKPSNYWGQSIFRQTLSFGNALGWVKHGDPKKCHYTHKGLL